MQCRFNGCERISAAKGLCDGHYQQHRAGKKLNSLRKRKKPLQVLSCEVDGCDNYVRAKIHGRSLCVTHYQKLMKHGHELGQSDGYRNRQRWLDANKGYMGDDCLKWPFSVSDHGRGTATLNGKSMSAPRAMCILAHGKPPTNRHHASHSCGNGNLGCMNPNHLVWKTPKQNERDKIKHGTLRRGEAINTCKLTKAQVYEIKGKIGSMTGVAIAKEYGVSPTVISNIKVGRSWGWL